MKPQHFAVLAGSLLAIALLLMLAGRPQTDGGRTAAETQPRTVTVTGEGEVRVKPDLATITVGVLTHGASAAEAEALNLASARQMAAALVENGADEERLEVSRVSLNTTSYQDYTGATHVSGFEAQSQVVAVTRNLNKVQSMVDSALNAGATSLQSVAYTLENPEPSKQAAMREAVENARARALTLVKAQGEGLGEIFTLEVLLEEGPPEQASSPGSLVYKAKVKVTFQY